MGLIIACLLRFQFYTEHDLWGRGINRPPLERATSEKQLFNTSAPLPYAVACVRSGSPFGGQGKNKTSRKWHTCISLQKASRASVKKCKKWSRKSAYVRNRPMLVHTNNNCTLVRRYNWCGGGGIKCIRTNSRHVLLRKIKGGDDVIITFLLEICSCFHVSKCRLREPLRWNIGWTTGIHSGASASPWRNGSMPSWRERRSPCSDRQGERTSQVEKIEVWDLSLYRFYAGRTWVASLYIYFFFPSSSVNIVIGFWISFVCWWYDWSERYISPPSKTSKLADDAFKQPVFMDLFTGLYW